MKVLDVGCGIGGPAKEIATFIDCKVVGLNNNDYQIEKGREIAQKEGVVEDFLELVKGDFMVCMQRMRRCQVARSLTFQLENAVPGQLVRRRVRDRSHSARTVSSTRLRGNLSRAQTRRPVWRLRMSHDS